MVGPVEHTPSFPSGHTIGTATFTLALAYLWWRARPSRKRAWVGLGVAAVLTAAMATSRLYLGDHWLTDVVASIVLSVGVMADVVPEQLPMMSFVSRVELRRWLDLNHSTSTGTWVRLSTKDSGVPSATTGVRNDSKLRA